MLSSNCVRGVWWACAALAGLLAAGCVSAASEESGGNSPISDGRGGGGAGSSSASSSSSVVDSSSPPPGGVTTTGVEETAAVHVGEGIGVGGEASSGGEVLEPGGGVVSVEVRVSEEGLERLRRVLGEAKFVAMLEEVEWLAEFDGVDSGVWLGRLAGENGFLTEEELGKLAERRSGEELAWAAHFYSEGVLSEYANEGEERMAGHEDIDVADVEGRFADEYSDEDVKGLAFVERAEAERDNRLWEDNDLSTPVGAFCWAVLRVRYIEDWTGTGFGTGVGGGFRPWVSRNLRVWHLEREAEERGIELEWETPPLNANRVLRRVLLEATAPEVRSVVFAPGLPSVLRPAAEALYSVYDELLALPVRRIRPTVEELSAYRRLRDLTEEEIAEIWPEEVEIDYRAEDNAKYWNAMAMLRDDEVREVLNAECKERPWESACPPWEVPETAVFSLSIGCNDTMKAIHEFGPFESCPLFYKADTREVGSDALESECTIDEEAAERIREHMERAEELGNAERFGTR